MLAADPEQAFEDLKRIYSDFDELAAAFRRAEQHYATTFPQGGYPVTDVVSYAWDMLNAQQQREQMTHLFACFWQQQMDIRKSLEMDGKAADGTSYLEPGDLDIIEDTFSGALAIDQFHSDGGDLVTVASIDGDDGSRLDEMFPGGMVPVHIDVLQRLVSEVELLRHRLNMRGGAADAR